MDTSRNGLISIQRELAEELLRKGGCPASNSLCRYTVTGRCAYDNPGLFRMREPTEVGTLYCCRNYDQYPPGSKEEAGRQGTGKGRLLTDRKSTRLNSSH